ncbi:lysophospholipid acyltransferase family protein [Bacteroidota bacterium]
MKKILYLIYQPYKWLFFFPFIILNTIIFALLAVIFSLLINQKTGSYIGGALWSKINTIFTPMLISVKGKQHINKDTSYIIIANHQSFWDIFAIYGWLGLDIKWVMKKELRKIPGIGFGSEKVGHIFIDRSNRKKAIESINEAKTKLVNGTSVVIFPEGTRSRTGEMGKFKKGAFKLAIDLDLPILPITIIGTQNIFPSGTLNLMPGKVKMNIHSPIDTTAYSDNNILELMSVAKVKIQSGFNS